MTRKMKQNLGKRILKAIKKSSIDEKMMLFEEEFNRAKAEGSLLDSTILDDNPSALKVRPKAVPSIGSMTSAMKPLPSEVVVNLKKGLYSTAGDVNCLEFCIAQSEL